jgi:hypothetical protein
MEFSTGQIDIDTALNYLDLDEDIYMRIPYGYVRYRLEAHKNDIDQKTHELLL